MKNLVLIPARWLRAAGLAVLVASAWRVNADDPGPLLRLGEPADGAVLRAPAKVTLRAELHRPLAIPTTIDFFADDRKVATGSLVPRSGSEITLPSGPTTFVAEWSDVPAGSYRLTARANVGRAVELVTPPVLVTVRAAEDPNEDVASLSITRPRRGDTIEAASEFFVEAFGIGRFGGITDVELLVDGRRAAESHLAFIRAPEADEPVYHSFRVPGLNAGSHELVVRELGNPSLASPAVVVRVVEPSPRPDESIRIVSPAPGVLVELGEPVTVEAVAIGRAGGITHVEFLIDGRKVGESELVFVRPPAPDEPIYHRLIVDAALEPGAHELRVQEAGNPELHSEPVSFHVIVTASGSTPAMFRLGRLVDGTLLLVLSAEDQEAGVRIESSADLLTWEPVGFEKSPLAVPVTGRPAIVPAGATRFYRAVRPGR